MGILGQQLALEFGEEVGQEGTKRRGEGGTSSARARMGQQRCVDMYGVTPRSEGDS